MLMSQTVSVITRSGAGYFLHASNLWHLYWRLRMQSHASNGEGWFTYGGLREIYWKYTEDNWEIL